MSNKDYSFRRHCNVTPDFSTGDIAIEEYSSFAGVIEESSRAFYRMKEAAIRDALIKLGWTPPADKVTTSPPSPS